MTADGRPVIIVKIGDRTYQVAVRTSESSSAGVPIYEAVGKRVPYSSAIDTARTLNGGPTRITIKPDE